MRITELFTAQSIALDEARQDRSQIIDRLVELQATHGNIRDKEAYKKGLYAREDEGSTYVDNGITVPHAKFLFYSSIIFLYFHFPIYNIPIPKEKKEEYLNIDV